MADDRKIVVGSLIRPTLAYSLGAASLLLKKKTRMVQLPATAAIEHVAACWVPGAGGIIVGGTRTKTKTVRGAYARSPQVQCVYAPSRLSVPSMIYVYPAGGRIQLT